MNSFRLVTIVLMVVTVALCTINSINAERKAISSLEANSTESNPIVIWNDLTTSLSLKEKFSPPELAGAYALVHISIYDSLLASNQSYRDIYDSRRSIATTAGAAFNILSYLFPDYIDLINEVKGTFMKETSSVPLQQLHNGIMETRWSYYYGEMDGKQVTEFAASQISNVSGTRNLDV